MAVINNSTTGKGVGEQPTLKSCLIDKIIKVRPTPIRKTPYIIGGDRDRVRSEQIMLSGTSRSIILPKNGLTNRFIDPLTYDERMYLEHILGVNLDINKPTDIYYIDDVCRIYITKNSDDIDDCYAELDLSTPIGYLQYKICLANPEVASAKNPEGKYTPEQAFYLDDALVETTVERDDNKEEDTCYKYLYSIEDRKDKLYNFLRTYNLLNKTRRYVDKNSSIEWMYNELKDLVRYRETRHKFYDLVEMIKKNEVSYELKIFIQDALEIGEIKYNSTDNIFTTPTGDKLGANIGEIENYLKDPLNQQKREYIKSQIKLQLK